eukprot:16440475-Heterocapsa_arctica.AAC.1
MCCEALAGKGRTCAPQALAWKGQRLGPRPAIADGLACQDQVSATQTGFLGASAGFQGLRGSLGVSRAYSIREAPGDFR